MREASSAAPVNKSIPGSAAPCSTRASVCSTDFYGVSRSFTGPHYTLDGITLSPTGVQQPRVPIWLAARGHTLAPVRRAARFDGVALLAATPERLGEIVECVRTERGSLDGFDFAIWETSAYPLTAYERQGATWAVHCPFEAITLTTDGRTSSVYDMRPDDALDHVMTTIAHLPR